MGIKFPLQFWEKWVGGVKILLVVTLILKGKITVLKMMV